MSLNFNLKLKLNHIDNVEFIPSEIIYSKSYSRPSKSLVCPELFTTYKNLKDSILFENTYELKFKECMNYIFPVYTIADDKCIVNDVNYIIVKFVKFEDVFNKINLPRNKNVIIQFSDVYIYPKLQFICILKLYFENVTISMSQFNNFMIIICSEKNVENIDINFKKLQIKDFNIKVDEYIIKTIHNYNNYIFNKAIKMNNYVINNCNSTSDLTYLNKDINLVDNYYKNYISKNCNNDCRPFCNTLHYSKILQCVVCEKCWALYT